MRTLKSVLICAAIATFLFACTANNPVNTSGNANSPAAPGTPATDTLATGRKLYNQNCAACHRVNGAGGKLDFEGKTLDPEDLTSEKMVKTSDDKLYGYIFDGIPDEGMPAFKEKLKEPQIREIVRFIRAELQKKE